MKRRRRGQSLVELAILMPFFMLIIVGGIIDFGFAFYNMLTLQQLANDAASWAAETNGLEGQDQSSVFAYINSKKPAYWSGTLTPGYTNNVPLDTGGKAVRVTITYENPFYTPVYQTLLQTITGNTFLTLSALAVYQVPQIVVTR